MGWSGEITRESAPGASMTFTPETAQEGAYTVAAFTAPKKGIYRFLLKGSGGTNGSLDAAAGGANGSQTVSGGAGGYTMGYLLLEEGETVYAGAGGTCSAAFIAGHSASRLSQVSMGALYFVAGGGGAAGRSYKNGDERLATAGGAGGGEAGEGADRGGAGGTQSAGGSAGGAYPGEGNDGAYGTGGAGAYDVVSGQDSRAWSGRGGDGFYGGGSGYAAATHNSATGFTGSRGYGGGGGSGYVKTKSLTSMGRTYISSTSAGGGAKAGECGEIEAAYYARAQLPVIFDGVTLEQLIFNGVEALGLVYNGLALYMKRLLRRTRYRAA